MKQDHYTSKYSIFFTQSSSARNASIFEKLSHPVAFKTAKPKLHSKTPHVVTVLWQDSDDVVTILSPTRNLVEGYKTMYLCHLDSYTVTVCNGI